MTATSIGRMVVLALAVVAGGAALVFGIPYLQQPSAETPTTTAAPAVAPPASAVPDQRAAAVAPAPPETSPPTAAPAVSPRAPDADSSAPAFDVARIEPSGEAVIAGRAAPGAVVELLINGQRHDQATADKSGLFVMVPPKLPPGDYQLTLRSRLPDGTQATSKQSVAVALNAPAVPDQPVASAQARQTSPPAVQVAKQQDIQVAKQQDAAAPQPSPAAAAISPPREATPSVVAVVPKIATATVSRGDSLWRISRATYGEGTRYALVYKANREKIRNPDRIYPGQVFVLPLKSR